jgi:transcriptional regulator with XRE-family HTH domain
MSYGHAGRLAAILAGTPAAAEADTPPTGPTSDARPPAPPWAELYDREDLRRILGERDIGALFRALKDDAGLTQRTIAELTGMAQSEVSEILSGRQVLAYNVLVRIVHGLGIPRVRMGLSYGESDAYPGQEAPQSGVTQEVTEAFSPRSDLCRRSSRCLMALRPRARFPYQIVSVPPT